MEELRLFLNKKVKIFTKNRSVFTGTLEEIYEKNLRLKDKFSEMILVNLDSIENVQEIGRDER